MRHVRPASLPSRALVPPGGSTVEVVSFDIVPAGDAIFVLTHAPWHNLALIVGGRFVVRNDRVQATLPSATSG